MDYNRAVIVGNLTRDPELKSLPSGISVCNIAVASNRKWKNKETGEQQQEVEYHNVVAFGKTAELINQYMTKGNKILVEGRLKTSSWEADGVKKYKTEIVAENIQFGPKANGTPGNQESNNNNHSQPSYHGDDGIQVDQIPF